MPDPLDPSKLREDERLRHNAAEQGISVAQAREVDLLMATPVGEWPSRAIELVRELGKHGICGEVFVTAAARYLKERDDA